MNDRVDDSNSTQGRDEFIGNGPVAIVGASPNRARFGTYVYRQLRDKGYRVYPVHPSGDPIDGDLSYRRLTDLPKPPEAAVFVLNPDSALAAVDDAHRAGVKRIWFQQGADFSEAAAKAEGLGIDTVTGRCIMMHAHPVKSIHALHRLLARLIKKL